MTKPDFERIKRHYRDNLPAIVSGGANGWGIDPYAWDHEAGISMTPIERALWSDIRAVGLVMYPQFPVGRFFVDFGNPVAKVAIECDGAAWHQDKKRDEERQARIEAMGWTVYRLSGVECFADGQEVESPGRVRFEPSNAARMLSAIRAQHFTDLEAA